MRNAEFVMRNYENKGQITKSKLGLKAEGLGIREIRN